MYNLNMSELWWKNAVIYEVYVDRFAGNFNGLAGRLSYLKDLGVNCIWLLPHYPSPMIDGGYDVSDFMNVRRGLGTLDDFRKFTRLAHDMGIKVVIDLVLNHVSVEHPWFREKPASPAGRKDFFLWSKTGKEFSQAVNPFSHMKPSNWIFDKGAGEYYFATFYPQQADLNWDNPEVFSEMMKVIDFWMDMGVDGFRLDAAPFLIKREGTECTNLPETHQVIKKIRAHIESKNSEVILLAEANGPAERVIEYFGQAGDECHMAFHFHLMSAMFMALKRGQMEVVENLVKNSFKIPDNCQWATFLRNHDELTLSHISPARRDELLKWLDPEHLYSFKGGHGASVRLATIFKGDKEKILNAFKLLFSLPGSPVIYSGDELGTENAKLQDKPVDTREYVRSTFDWREADKQMADPGSVFNGLKKIISSR